MADKLQFILGLDYDSFKKGISGAEGAFRKFGSSIRSILGVMGIGFGLAQIKSFIDELDELGKRADDLDMTAASLKALSVQAELAGISSTEFDSAMKKIQLSIGSVAQGSQIQTAALKRLGVEFQNADGSMKSTEEILYGVADGFKNFANKNEAAAIANDLFGKSGYKMVRILSEGGDALRQGGNPRRRRIALRCIVVSQE